ncbi:hypothetical protein TNCV_1962351 [Trichonephila clavipes]|nr:hypothetical protein TNCV_1962351 [Trichonephila clavipes]
MRLPLVTLTELRSTTPSSDLSSRHLSVRRGNQKCNQTHFTQQPKLSEPLPRCGTEVARTTSRCNRSRQNHHAATEVVRTTSRCNRVVRTTSHCNRSRQNHFHAANRSRQNHFTLKPEVARTTSSLQTEVVRNHFTPPNRSRQNHFTLQPKFDFMTQYIVPFCLSTTC